MGTQAGAGVSEEIRCPSCSRLLVLRSGPQITPHFAHRPRQACRRRPGRTPVTPLRLEQLTLFDVEPLTAQPVPVFYFRPRPAPMGTPASAASASRSAIRRQRRRQRAWLPRLIRWLRARATSGRIAGRRSSAFTPETRGNAGPRI